MVSSKRRGDNSKSNPKPSHSLVGPPTPDNQPGCQRDPVLKEDIFEQPIDLDHSGVTVDGVHDDWIMGTSRVAPRVVLSLWSTLTCDYRAHCGREVQEGRGWRGEVGE